MKLHCEICGLYDPETGKDHKGSHSEVAVINTDKLCLPLDGSMFDSINPERGLAAPWQAGITWDHMKCPRGNHLVFNLMPEDVQDMQKRGGSRRLFTDEGFIELTTEGFMKVVSKHPMADWKGYMLSGGALGGGMSGPKPTIFPINKDRELTCNCGKLCKSKAGLSSHMRHCNNGR